MKQSQINKISCPSLVGIVLHSTASFPECFLPSAQPHSSKARRRLPKKKTKNKKKKRENSNVTKTGTKKERKKERKKGKVEPEDMKPNKHRKRENNESFQTAKATKLDKTNYTDSRESGGEIRTAPFWRIR